MTTFLKENPEINDTYSVLPEYTREELEYLDYRFAIAMEDPNR